MLKVKLIDVICGSLQDQLVDILSLFQTGYHIVQLVLVFVEHIIRKVYDSQYRRGDRFPGKDKKCRDFFVRSGKRNLNICVIVFAVRKTVQAANDSICTFRGKAGEKFIQKQFAGSFCIPE